MKLFSMFSGIGGFELGFLSAFPDGEVVGYSEINPFAIAIYNHQFKDAVNYGSATDIIPERLPDFDVLTAGFPCQAFSISGKRKGFEDARGTMFFEIARILQNKRPGYFVLENVRGLLSHAKGKTFGRMLEILDELDYTVQTTVLNTRDFGIPQNRERVFFVGSVRGKTAPEIFLVGKGSCRADAEKQSSVVRTFTDGGKSGGHHSQMTLLRWNNNNTGYVKGEVAGTLRPEQSTMRKMQVVVNDNGRLQKKDSVNSIDSSYYKGRDNHGQRSLVQVGTIGDDSESTRVYSPDGIARCIKDKREMGSKTGLYAVGYTRDKDGKRTNHLKEEFGTIKSTVGNNQSDFVIISSQPRSGDPSKGGTGNLTSKDYSFTLNRNPHFVNCIRRLTPTECEKLQGFPIGWTELGLFGDKIKPISDTQRYQRVGNAVSVPVVAYLMEKIKCVLE